MIHRKNISDTCFNLETITKLSADANVPGPRLDDVQASQLYELPFDSKAHYTCILRSDALQQLYIIEQRLTEINVFELVEFRNGFRRALNLLRRIPEQSEPVTGHLYALELDGADFALYYILNKTEVEVLRIYPNTHA